MSTGRRELSLLPPFTCSFLIDIHRHYGAQHYYDANHLYSRDLLFQYKVSAKDGDRQFHRQKYGA